MVTVSPQMKKMLFITGIVFGLIFGWYVVKKVLFFVFISTYEMPAVTISATIAKPQTWQSYLTSVGTLVATDGVDISSEVSGIVRETHFTSGQFVKKGDLLVRLDTSVEEAQLKDNQARLKLAQLNFDRDKTLLRKNVASQSVVDTDLATFEEAQAGVEVIQAHIKQKTVTAPFDGRVGINQVDLGQYLAAGTTMVTLQAVDPMHVKFNLPEQYIPNLYIGQTIEADVNLNVASHKATVGTLTAINSKVDQTTHNILVEGTIPNKNLQLYPGMFAVVKIWLHDQKNVITLPQTAISYSLHGDSVFLIKDKGKKKHPKLYVTRQYVKVGERRGSLVVIDSGIKAGDQVATSGQLKLQNDTRVIIDNSVEL